MSVTIRLATEEDAPYLVNWLQDAEVLQWFPMDTLPEIEHSVEIWKYYASLGAAMTAEIDGEVCGIANLYVQSYPEIAHQCLFSIVVGEAYRGKGVGTKLLEALIALGANTFGVEILHLEVYRGNPAIHLYQRLGFKEYGVHKRFLKDKNGEYHDKILMEYPIKKEGKDGRS